MRKLLEFLHQQWHKHWKLWLEMRVWSYFLCINQRNWSCCMFPELYVTICVCVFCVCFSEEDSEERAQSRRGSGSGSQQQDSRQSLSRDSSWSIDQSISEHYWSKRLNPDQRRTWGLWSCVSCRRRVLDSNIWCVSCWTFIDLTQSFYYFLRPKLRLYLLILTCWHRGANVRGD